MPEPMPVLEVGDWVLIDESPNANSIECVTAEQVAALQSMSADKAAEETAAILEIRKAHGTIWRRDAQDT